MIHIGLQTTNLARGNYIHTETQYSLVKYREQREMSKTHECQIPTEISQTQQTDIRLDR